MYAHSKVLRLSAWWEIYVDATSLDRTLAGVQRVFHVAAADYVGCGRATLARFMNQMSVERTAGRRTASGRKVCLYQHGCDDCSSTKRGIAERDDLCLARRNDWSL